jgi:hypothetical protein
VTGVTRIVVELDEAPLQMAARRWLDDNPTGTNRSLVDWSSGIEAFAGNVAPER